MWMPWPRSRLRTLVSRLGEFGCAAAALGESADVGDVGEARTEKPLPSGDTAGGDWRVYLPIRAGVRDR